MSKESTYSANIARLKSGDFSIPDLTKQVGEWIKPRRAILNHDKQVYTISQLATPDEVRESLAERNKYGTPEDDPKARHTEDMDTVFLPFAMGIAIGLEFDAHQVMPYVNGKGDRSDIFDQLIERSGNIEKKSLLKDTHHLMTYLVAYLASSPEPFGPSQVMQSVLEKNSLNYPQEFFLDEHPFLERRLNPDELNQQYLHSRKCLKMIRFAHRELLQQKDRDYGLRPEDWNTYRHLIIDFTHSEINVMQLAIRLTEDLHLTQEQSLAMLKEVKLSSPNILPNDTFYSDRKVA